MTLDTFISIILPASLPGILALFGAYYGTNRASETQLRTAALNTYLSARLDAYKEYEFAMEKWGQSQDSANTAAVYRASNVVCLVASQETIKKLGVVGDMIRKHELSQAPLNRAAFEQAKIELSFSMHHDLLSYPTPVPAKNHKTRFLVDLAQKLHQH